jgi:hypothetical protein
MSAVGVRSQFGDKEKVDGVAVNMAAPSPSTVSWPTISKQKVK